MHDSRANISLSIARVQSDEWQRPLHSLSLPAGYFDALSDFPCLLPLAPPSRNRLRARGTHAASRRRAVPNAPAPRRPAPDLTLLAPLPEPRCRAPGRSHPHAVSSNVDRIGVPVVKKTKTCYLTELDVARLEKHAARAGAQAHLQRHARRRAGARRDRRFTRNSGQRRHDELAGHARRRNQRRADDLDRGLSAQCGLRRAA